MRRPRDPYSVVVALIEKDGAGKMPMSLARAIADCSVEEEWPYEVLGGQDNEVWVALSRPEGCETTPAEELAREAVGHRGAIWRIVKFGH